MQWFPGGFYKGLLTAQSWELVLGIALNAFLGVGGIQIGNLRNVKCRSQTWIPARVVT